MDYGFKYIIDHGIGTEASYPYTARDGRCKSGEVTTATLSSYTDVGHSQSDLASASSQRVVSVAVDAQRWSSYRSGIMESSACGTSLDHGVTLVGYNTADNYWIVKNSWSTSWGEQGYIRLEKNVQGSQGVCGIYMAASYPVV